MWSRLFAWDSRKQEWNPEIFGEVTASGILPFRDLWHWFVRNETKAAAECMRRYLAITSPLITITQSQPVSSLVAGNLVHDRDLIGPGFIAALEISRLATFANPAWMNNGISGPPKTHFTLQIPVIDPGAAKYRGGQREILIKRLTNSCYYVCFLACGTALSVEMD
ncbi:hypothetical protein LTS18_002991 [Coniosporium uncinatum]|uniref:Uncharacterized protein n=1 Tax=Coniosporium uncinatum TaxID=93489 RepID=A0ACC3DYE8_9PEZI|nr:hypothetical protein LTS18_002991 [Coniosporium uncinatum]